MLKWASSLPEEGTCDRCSADGGTPPYGSHGNRRSKRFLYQLRCELLIPLRAGDRVRSLLAVLADDFVPLPRVTSREKGTQVSQLFDRAPSVREWLLREGEGSDRL